MHEILASRYRNRLRVAFNAIAKDIMLTSAQQRHVTRLIAACYGRMQAGFDRWKYDTFATKRMAMESKKARVCDLLSQNLLSDSHRALLRWAKNARDLKMF